MATLLANAPADKAVLFAEEIDDLMLEARNYLDGEPIANEDQANAVSSLLNRARRVAKDADAERATEKKPHDDAGKAVQAKWKPLIDKAELAANTCKQALAPYLQAKEAALEADAAKAREEALRLQQIALEARQQASGNLEAAEDAERLLKAASAAAADATKAGKQKAHATGGERAIGLRSVFTPTLTDSGEALKHYRETRPDELKAWLVDQAEKDVRAGARSIPGFTIAEDRVAV